MCVHIKPHPPLSLSPAEDIQPMSSGVVVDEDEELDDMELSDKSGKRAHQLYTVQILCFCCCVRSYKSYIIIKNNKS